MSFRLSKRTWKLPLCSLCMFHLYVLDIEMGCNNLKWWNIFGRMCDTMVCVTILILWRNVLLYGNCGTIGNIWSWNSVFDNGVGYCCLDWRSCPNNIPWANDICSTNNTAFRWYVQHRVSILRPHILNSYSNCKCITSVGHIDCECVCFSRWDLRGAIILDNYQITEGSSNATDVDSSIADDIYDRLWARNISLHAVSTCKEQ